MREIFLRVSLACTCLLLTVRSVSWQNVPLTNLTFIHWNASIVYLLFFLLCTALAVAFHTVSASLVLRNRTLLTRKDKRFFFTDNKSIAMDTYAATMYSNLFILNLHTIKHYAYYAQTQSLPLQRVVVIVGLLLGKKSELQ